jgi:hypothetical protein
LASIRLLWTASLAVPVHSLAMLITAGLVALIVYQRVGLNLPRHGWINLNLLWTAAPIGLGGCCCREPNRSVFRAPAKGSSR